MGHQEHRLSAPRAVGVALLTVSDTRSPENDLSGRLAADLCRAAGHHVVSAAIVPDDPVRVSEALGALLADRRVQAVLINGGTGISARDTTLEAVGPLLERRLDGFGELFRWLSFSEVGPAAMLSRAAAGLCRGRAVFCMPGSPQAVRLAMERLILPELGHVVAEAGKPT
ncbi:MAG TPA: molybdenum cofactor biosynthesis protein B [Candidatus Polarisedimenticolia bacterium]|nr:molybdenum cofactor biosynthesis protein B [Candidatus Polarisedimenticolia bacterium]